ncbi:hypothetical protein BHZ80_27590 [Salmonella enterica]|nr:hypothetical protein [Salmonella enterica]EAA9598959.1 hypothetical protein [Salmonella enterica]EAO9641662.1 hypothetical protein [Salmonella enterica]EKI3327278.1 hypothetical protein [Salmonella enterica]
MYAKSFIALDGNCRLTGARTAQTAPYDRYTCHLCNSALHYQGDKRCVPCGTGIYSNEDTDAGNP